MARKTYRKVNISFLDMIIKYLRILNASNCSSLEWLMLFVNTRPRGYKKAFMLNWAESMKAKLLTVYKFQETRQPFSFSDTRRMLFILLINFKMPTIRAESISCSADLSMNFFFITSRPAQGRLRRQECSNVHFTEMYLHFRYRIKSLQMWIKNR